MFAQILWMFPGVILVEGHNFSVMNILQGSKSKLGASSGHQHLCIEPPGELSIKPESPRFNLRISNAHFFMQVP